MSATFVNAGPGRWTMVLDGQSYEAVRTDETSGRSAVWAVYRLNGAGARTEDRPCAFFTKWWHFQTQALKHHRAEWRSVAAKPRIDPRRPRGRPRKPRPPEQLDLIDFLNRRTDP